METRLKYSCNDFCTQFCKLILRYTKIGYNINVMRHTACMVVVNPVMVNDFASLFDWTPAGRASDSIKVPDYRLLSQSVGA